MTADNLGHKEADKGLTTLMYFYMTFVQSVLISCLCLHFLSQTFGHKTECVQLEGAIGGQKSEIKASEKEGQEPTGTEGHDSLMHKYGKQKRKVPGGSLLL